MTTYIEDGEARLAGRAMLAITGGPTADFNIAVIDACPEDGALFTEFVQQVEQRGLPCVFMLSGACAGRLEPLANKMGLLEAGTAPLMALEGAPPVPSQSGFAIHRITDKEGAAMNADLVASAFALDRAWVGRTFSSEALLDAPSFSFFLASKEGQPFSGVTTSMSGTTVGIWSMATPANRQRKGAGRAALIGAIEHHRGLGATTFYLIATPAGKPLYDSVGFKTVDEAHLWVAGHSEQFSPH